MLARLAETFFPVRLSERRLTLVLFVHSFFAVGAFLAGRSVRDALSGKFDKEKATLPAGQTRTLRTIADLILHGHAQLAAHQYLVACDDFRLATDKAVKLH